MNNNIFKRGLTYLYNRFAKVDNTAELINYASTGCMILASIANLIGISIDKKTSKNEKMFLIPQEAADGLTSIALYFGFSEGMRKSAAKLMDTEKIQLRGIDLKSPNFKKGREGVLIVASLIGSILAGSVITPIVRNIVGAHVRNGVAKKTGKEAPKTPDYIVHPMPKVENAQNLAHLHTTPIRMDRIQSGLRV